MSIAPQPYSLTDTWLLNNRVNMKLLEALTDSQLAYSPSVRAKSIADQFAHLFNARLMWLQVQAPPLARTLSKIERGTSTRTSLQQALTTSAEAVANVLAESQSTGKLKRWKRGAVAFLGYLLAHEGHHRGQIILHLKQAKMPIDSAVGYSLWEWDKI